MVKAPKHLIKRVLVTPVSTKGIKLKVIKPKPVKLEPISSKTILKAPKVQKSTTKLSLKSKKYKKQRKHYYDEDSEDDY